MLARPTSGWVLDEPSVKSEPFEREPEALMVNTPDVLVPSLSTSPSHSTTPAVCEVEPPLPSVGKPDEVPSSVWQSVDCAKTRETDAGSIRKPARTIGTKALRTNEKAVITDPLLSGQTASENVETNRFLGSGPTAEAIGSSRLPAGFRGVPTSPGGD